jgi:Na+/proline symporter
VRGLTTYADLFRQRYSWGVERLIVIVLLPGSVIWAAAQIRAFGQVLAANSSLKLGLAIALAAGLVAAYSVVGGPSPTSCRASPSSAARSCLASSPRSRSTA